MRNGEVIINRRDFLKIALGGGAALAGYKLFQKDIERILYGWGNAEPQPRAPTPAVNETVKPTETLAPKFDYYDEEFKVGINIEGLDKQNVINLIRTFKEVTPDDYADLIKYAPKKITRSPDSFSWYAFNSTSDEIQLPEGIEKWGSDDFNIRKRGLPSLYAEFTNAKIYKSGHTISILDQEKGKFSYAVKLGLMTEEQANKSIESVSERLKTGTYFNDAKLDQS